jgi:TonB family protein
MSLLGAGSSPGCPGWPHDERSPSLSWCSKQFLRRYRVKAYVTEQGRVEEVQVEQSAGHPDLDQSAIEAVGRWRFEPARRGRQPVAMWVSIPVKFVLSR